MLINMNKCNSFGELTESEREKERETRDVYIPLIANDKNNKIKTTKKRIKNTYEHTHTLVHVHIAHRHTALL
jgi:hypothetical protein